jgi:hypothetical protein
MVASGKTPSRIITLVGRGSLSLGTRMAELGTQNRRCEQDAIVRFLRVSPVLPIDPKMLFARLPFGTIHAAYWSRVKDIIFERIGF